jgi:DMSO/TMAO reductase YedYZ molybdopterin-dependent catalytic subunit/ferredoxin-NADP reductase
VTIDSPSVISRGFGGVRRPGQERLPDGQYLETGFPVMSVGPTPPVKTDTWEFRVTTETGEEHRWDWDAFRGLPAHDITTDIHCVTKWSKLDTRWRGVSLDTLLEDVGTDAAYVLAEAADGYTTNLPLPDLRGGQAWLAFACDGRPLEPEHGGPVRLLVPHLYLWKSAKWLTGLRLLQEDEPGFWENLGYHDYGDPWREQRYRGTYGAWRTATVTATRAETAAARTIVLDVPGLPPHVAGQQVDVKLTAADGYSAQRSYSIASAPDAARLELTVQRIDGGEVSPYLTRDLRPGDQFEVRGPIGGSFTWEPDTGAPLLLIAGGSGVVPLMSMIRASKGQVPARLVYSARTPADVIYAPELSERIIATPLDVTFCYTRAAPPGARLGRIGADVIPRPADYPAPEIFVCGPAGFVETAASLLIEAGYSARDIATERFGPTG